MLTLVAVWIDQRPQGRHTKADGEARCAAALFLHDHDRAVLLYLPNTPNLFFSTVFIITGFPAAALTMLRSPYYAPGYAAKENPAYLPVAVNFLIFFFQRPLRIPLPEKAGARSVLTEFSSMQKGAADF